MEEASTTKGAKQGAKNKKNDEKMDSLFSLVSFSEETKKIIKTGFSKANRVETEKVLDEVIPILIEKMSLPDASEYHSAVLCLISFLKTLPNWADFGKRLFVRDLFTFMSVNLTNDEMCSTWKSHMIQLMTKFVQTTHYNEHSRAGMLLLKYLFSIALPQDEKRVTTADVKRIKELKNFIVCLDLLEPSANPVLLYFMKAVVSKNFLSCREGILVLAYFLSKETSLVKTVQTKIRDNLGNLKKKLAQSYGDVYFHAWILSDGTEVRKEIEHQCIQDIMRRTMTLMRNGVEMGPIGSLAFSILHVLRENRRLPMFSQVITDLYQPIIWRSLKSDNALERCNAAQVFFDAFPLEKVGVGAVENCRFKDMQVNEIIELLLDECHLVRIVSVKGLVNVLKHSLDLLSVADLKRLMTILSDKLAFDASCYSVRLAVFDTFRALIACDKSRALVFPILKTMNLSLHDENEKVRNAFVKVLLTLNELKDPEYRYWDIAPLTHILYRLKEEGPLVGALLAQLILPSIYETGQFVETTIKNFTRIITVSDLALMNLFRHSKKLLPVMDAYAILITIVGTLKKQLKLKREAMVQDENESPTQKKGPNGKSRSNNDSNIANQKDESSDKTQSDGSVETTRVNLLDNHKLVSGLILSACVLWATHMNEIGKTVHYQKLSGLTASTVAPLLLFYKGTKVYYNVVSLATFVPLSLLSPQSTVAGACLSELREMNETCDPEVINCLVTALCLWNRGPDLMELARDWLNQAFRHQDLNSTVLAKRTRKRTPRVRFEPVKGKPHFAIKLLKNLFLESACQQKVVEKNYDQMYNFFKFLSRIKDLIEKRIQNGEPWDEYDLNDTFLEDCLSIYLNMIIVLHRPDSPPNEVSFSSEASVQLQAVSAPSTSTEMMDWAFGVFSPILSDQSSSQNNFASRCLNLVLDNAVLAINLNYTSKEHCLLTLFMIFRLNNTENCLEFLDVALRAMKAASEHSMAYNTKDEWSIFSVHIPKLLQACLGIVSSNNIDASSGNMISKDFKKFKVNFFSPLMGLEKYYGRQHQSFIAMCNDYLETAVTLIAEEISAAEAIEVYSKLNDQPFFTSLIIKYFLSKPYLANLILPWMESYTMKNEDNPAVVVSAISLLSTLALSCKSKFQVEHLENCFARLFKTVKTFDEEISSKGEEIIMEVCRETGCALLNISDTNQR